MARILCVGSAVLADHPSGVPLEEGLRQAGIEACGFPRPEIFLRKMRSRFPDTLLSAAWGDEGAWAVEADGTLHHAPAVAPPAVVDTLGAGDTFNAGMIGALATGRSLRESLAAACRLAGRKVGRVGLDGLST